MWFLGVDGCVCCRCRVMTYWNNYGLWGDAMVCPQCHAIWTKEYIEYQKGYYPNDIYTN